TTHIHRRRRRARGAFAEPERRATAARAEMVLDHVLVEGVGSHPRFRRIETQLLARNEPEQVAFAAAMGAVALHRLREVPFHFERNAAAVAAAFVDHLVGAWLRLQPASFLCGSAS